MKIICKKFFNLKPTGFPQSPHLNFQWSKEDFMERKKKKLKIKGMYNRIWDSTY